MASNTFTRHTITGSVQHSRKGTQGRHKSGQPLATCKIIWNVTEEQKREFSELAERYGISESKLVDILVFIGKRNFLNQSPLTQAVGWTLCQQKGF